MLPGVASEPQHFVLENIQRIMSDLFGDLCSLPNPSKPLKLACIPCPNTSIYILHHATETDMEDPIVPHYFQVHH